MNLRRKEWSEEHKEFRSLLKKETTFQEAKELFFKLHGEVHSGFSEGYSFETELWENLSDEAFRSVQNKKGRTVAYGIWHSTRIEDMTMNLLVTDGVQVIDEGDWQKKINASIYDTGNALTPDRILAFSKTIDMEQLRAYRYDVGKRTREIVEKMTYAESGKKVSSKGIETILERGAVVQDDKAIWLIDYWKDKTAAGILLMPATRHLLVHINESMDAKKRAK